MEKENEIEIIAPEHDKAAMIRAMLKNLVREELEAQRQAEPEKLAIEVQRQRSIFERKKHVLYYAKWGCRRCNTKDKPHCCGGYCNTCNALMVQREIQLKREFEREHPENPREQAEKSTEKVRLAERLLGQG